MKNDIFCISLILALSTTGCGGGDDAAATAAIPTASTTLTGTITYDFVPVSTLNTLDYANTIQKPVRGAKICAAGTTTVCQNTGSDGSYSFSSLSDDSVNLYVYAQTDTITVEDNTNSDAIYAMFSSVDLNTTSPRNLNAPSGWSGSNTTGSYTTGTRVSGPFAILDTLYETQKAFETADSSLAFPALKVNWSVDNVPTDGNKSAGEITTSHWDGTELYILGKADSDTDEFDAGVMIHEWGHYFESELSRSDSIGGAHTNGDIKDIRLAFGEGWGNALAGMMLDDHNYRDTYGSKQQTGFNMDLEAGSDAINPDWFSEASIQLALYDIFDTTDDAGDTVSLGLAPIINVLTGAQKTTPALTSIFSFITALKDENVAAAADINALTTARSISSVTDVYGTGETNNGGDVTNLTVYKSIAKGGVDVNVTMGGANNTYNSLNNNRYLTFTGDGASTTISVTTTDQDSDTIADEDISFRIYTQGVNITDGNANANINGNIDQVYVGTETATINTTNGTVYTIVIRGYLENTTQYTASTNVN